MSFVGRKQERELNLFGRYMRIACRNKAKALGIPRYTWQQLSEEAGTNPTILTKAVNGDSRPTVQNVWKWIRILEPDPELERLICESLDYATEAGHNEAIARIDEIERESEQE